MVGLETASCCTGTPAAAYLVLLPRPPVWREVAAEGHWVAQGLVGVLHVQLEPQAVGQAPLCALLHLLEDCQRLLWGAVAALALHAVHALLQTQHTGTGLHHVHVNSAPAGLLKQDN